MRQKIIDIVARHSFMDCMHDGHYTVTYDTDDQTMPYRVYRHWTEFTDHGISKRKKQITKCSDYASVTWLLYLLTTNQVYPDQLERREKKV